MAYVDLSRPDAVSVLDRHLEFPNVRGIRQMLHAGPAMSYLASGLWQQNIAELARRRLSFDLQIQPAQMEAAADVIAANPDIQFILDHAGCPPSPATDPTLWASGLARLAALPNIAVKLSGFGMFDRDWTARSIAPIVQRIVSLFGAERCMFGSNFPVDSLMRDYRSIWTAFGDAVAHLSPSEQHWLFYGTAAKIYRI